MAGMKVGEKKQVVVAPAQGYGEINPNALQKVPRSVFKNTKGLKPGMMVTGSDGQRRAQAKVVKIDKKEVTLDTNHPLAGKTLTFDVEVTAISDAPAAPTAPGPAPTAPQ
jgi:FKBP-type peptidyl-prolyl cis-trans isomerase SlyD